MIQRKYYKTIRVIVDSDGGGTPFYIENVDTQTGYFGISKPYGVNYTPNLYYRIDNGEWFEYDVVNLPRIEVPIGSKIYLKGNNTNGFNQSMVSTYQLKLYSSSTTTSDYCKCNIGGYLTSLLALENFNLISNIPSCSFCSLFSDFKTLISAENLITSNITSVSSSSFYTCFSTCKSLVIAPKFENITILPQQSFQGCFRECSSLVTPPTFENVTRVESSALIECFRNCSSLVTSPTFENVTTVESYGFRDCFSGCTSLGIIIAPRPSTWVLVGAFYSWVTGVPTGGTFYKKKGLEIPTGVNGIPEGWTVVEED